MNEGEMPAEEDADAPLSDEAAGTASRGWGGGRGGVRGGGRGGSGGPGQGPGSYAGPARLGVVGEPEKTNARTPGSVCLTSVLFELSLWAPHVVNPTGLTSDLGGGD